MSKVGFAVGMVTGGWSNATAPSGLGVLAVASAGAAMVAPMAHASPLVGTFDGGLGNPAYVEAFDVQSNGGYVDEGSSAYFDFAVTNDTQGNNVLFFGDLTTKGFFGTGTDSGAGASATKFDFTFPPFYADAPFTLQPGVYQGDFGTTLTLTAVPEPEAWALLIAGAALVGGAARVARRRQSAAIA
jgi:hypothetical protein